MIVSVVVLPTDMIDCNRDPIHEGHADCPVHPNAGKAFVARYSWGSEGNGISEYLSTTGEWIEGVEGGTVPEQCFHAVRP